MLSHRPFFTGSFSFDFVLYIGASLFPQVCVMVFLSICITLFFGDWIFLLILDSKKKFLVISVDKIILRLFKDAKEFSKYLSSFLVAPEFVQVGAFGG